jgi:hypothetical protein
MGAFRDFIDGLFGKKKRRATASGEAQGGESAGRVTTTSEETYREQDNLGTRHETYQEASTFWAVNMHQDIGPYLVYVFDKEADARRAMLDIGCFHQAADTGNLICTEVLTYGCYAAPDGTWEAEILGKDLSHDLWTAAKESFRKHGGHLKYDAGALKSESEPERSETESRSDQSRTSQVTFVREVKQTSQVNGQEMTYRIHTGPDAEAAKDFLKDHPVTKKMYYILVETPDGTYGRDVDGIYQQ